jgi:endonuclease/exonuclease/phosphatase family metal-dependent hydrolase
MCLLASVGTPGARVVGDLLTRPRAAVNVTNKRFTTTKKWRGTIDHWTPKETEHRVDQIWVPDGVQVTDWTHRLQPPSRSVSDHDMLVARLVPPYRRPS